LKTRIWFICFFTTFSIKKSGGYRTRTDHLKHAMLALYQMS
jgi:hypothetical protein